MIFKNACYTYRIIYDTKKAYWGFQHLQILFHCYHFNLRCQKENKGSDRQTGLNFLLSKDHNQSELTESYAPIFHLKRKKRK